MTRVMIRGMSQSKFLGESELVGHFLHVLGYRDFSLHDPNVQPGVETGSDVLVLLDSKRYGVQVTVLHTDEGLSSRQRGSELRSQEANFKNSTQPMGTQTQCLPCDTASTTLLAGRIFKTEA